MTTAVVEKKHLPAELQGLTPGSAYNLDQMYRLAQICHASGLFEDVTDAAQAFAKIAQGQELGLGPMAAMRAFDIIRKRLYVKPAFIAAKINASGYGRYKVLEQSPERCIIHYTRKVDGVWEDCPDVSYTYAEAKAHGLVDRSPHWKASPAHMLYQRCMGRGGAMYFPELLAGLTPPPEVATPDPEGLRENVRQLFGETADPTIPVVATPLPIERPAQAPPQYGPAWETLEAHRDDGRLPEDVLERIAAALSPLAPASEAEAQMLAGVVLDWLEGHNDEVFGG